MKKAGTIILIVSVILLIASCGSAPAPVNMEKNQDLPDFVINPPVAEDAVYGVGGAKLKNMGLAKNAAVARARTDIAFQINSTIKAAITDYAQEAGAEGSSQTINFVESVSRQITETKLAGTTIEKYARSSDGTWYALISYPKGNFVADADEAFKRNEGAAFAEFKADQALKYLETELDNNPPKSSIVSE